jgi:hypothetical protein
MCGIWRADCGEAASRRRDFERKCLRRPMLVGDDVLRRRVC